MAKVFFFFPSPPVITVQIVIKIEGIWILILIISHINYLDWLSLVVILSMYQPSKHLHMSNLIELIQIHNFVHPKWWKLRRLELLNLNPLKEHRILVSPMIIGHITQFCYLFDKVRYIFQIYIYINCQKILIYNYT